MRIAVVTPFLDRHHGTERALAEQIEHLTYRYGYEVHLYAQRVESDVLQNRNAPRGTPSGAILWHRLPSFPAPHLLGHVVWMIGNTVLRRLSIRRHQLRFDLTFSAGINCLDADAIIVHALFNRLQEILRQKSEHHRTAPGFLRRLHRRFYYGLLAYLERRIYSDPKVSLAAVSQRTADLLARYFQRRDVRVIPNGVDCSQFSIATRLARRAASRERRGFYSDDFVLLLIGNDWYTKGLPVTLSAIAGLGQLPVQLLVVGSDAPAPFQRIASSVRVLERCRWEPLCADVLDLYAAADAYVSPTYEDAFALPPLEAMACGLPVITTTNNGGSQVITHERDGFILNDPDDSASLTQLLHRLSSNSDLCREIGENASRTAQTYTWDRSAEGVWNFLNDVQARKQKI